MTITEYHAMLTQFLQEHPECADHKAVYAVDDEGNEYQEIDIRGMTSGWIEKGYRSDTFLDQDDLDEDPSWDVSDMVASVLVN